MNWTEKEVKHTVDAYFDMLQFELKHLKYNKTDYRNKLIPFLKGRSASAVERKHQNISAVLRAMGLPFISGYKPLPHYQQMLEEHVAIYLTHHKRALESAFKTFSEEVVGIEPPQIQFSKLLDKHGPKGTKVKTEKEPTFRPIKINYLEREQNNRLLGQQGERLIVQYEQWRLIKAGKEKLAEKVEWVSKEKGDGAGFDILSKNTNGSDRFIEVKTTKLSKETPIYLTRKEVAFAQKYSNSFYLYRIYNWIKKPQLFVKSGGYENFCKLKAMSFMGTF